MPPTSHLGENILVLDLRRLPKTTAELLSLIPMGVGGVYAFYLPLEHPELATLPADALASELARSISLPRSTARTGNLPPAHRITLRSRVRLPAAKQEALTAWLSYGQFRDYLAGVLAYDFLFSAPLYIGKADLFRQRLPQHFDGSSGLLEDLRSNGVSLHSTKLLLVTVPIDLATISTAADADGTELHRMAPNVLLEDILSRLALPGFTKRIG